MNTTREWTPLIIVVSAPSGAGKTTLCNRLMAEFGFLHNVVTSTTRPPREGETHGQSYYFMSREEFDEHVARGDFLEHADVHGFCYGTLKSVVAQGLAEGKDILMNLDVQGAASIREYVRAAAPDDPLKKPVVDVFILTPTLDDLQARLFGRGQDDEAVIRRRLEKAEEEIARCREYRYVIVNDRLDESYDALRAVLVAEHHRIRART